MRGLVLLVALLLLTGCATTAKYESALQTWVGKDVNQLMQSWGPASSVQDMPSGGKMYTYLRSGGTHTTANYNQFVGVQAQSYEVYCKTTFFTRLDIVETWRWEGNACRSE